MGGFRSCVSAITLGFGLLAVTLAPVRAWNPGEYSTLAILPDVTPGVPSSVEGLTVGPDGNVYVPSFGFNYNGAITGNAVLFVISPNGQIVRQVTVPNSSPHILGLGFNPVNGFLLLLDFGAGRVLHVDPVTGNSSIFVNTIANSGLNGITFDKAGNVYFSDSFNGVIWTTGPNGPPNGGPPTAWSNDPLLGPGTGLTPPFGANGIEFNNAGTLMYVANTAFHQIIKIPVEAGGKAGQASIFITGINAPDGIAIDANDNLWVCSNQEDKITVIDPTGKVIAKLGDFNGIDNGLVKGLLFPASPRFSNDGRTLYVSNLTLYLPYAGAEPAVDSAWTLEARQYTVEQIRAVIPPLGKPEMN
jgi:sugar lactone lactonase YvrE